MRLMEENTADTSRWKMAAPLCKSPSPSFISASPDRAPRCDLDGDCRCRQDCSPDPAFDRCGRQHRLRQSQCSGASARGGWRCRQPVSHIQQDGVADPFAADEILEAKDEVDDRRRFIEAVLSGVTAAVIGVEDNGIVTIVNPSAEFFLACRQTNSSGRNCRSWRRGRSGAQRGRRSPSWGISRADQHDPRRQGKDPERAGHRARKRVGLKTVMSSRWMTSPISWWRNAPRPGPMSPAASPRDQEPADADPAVRRAFEAALRQADRRR